MIITVFFFFIIGVWIGVDVIAPIKARWGAVSIEAPKKARKLRRNKRNRVDARPMVTIPEDEFRLGLLEHTLYALRLGMRLHALNPSYRVMGEHVVTFINGFSIPVFRVTEEAELIALDGSVYDPLGERAEVTHADEPEFAPPEYA